MLILVTTAHPQALQHQGDGFGRLIQPRDYGRIEDTAAAGIPWAADNDCFQGLDPHAFTRMLDRIQGVPGCRFVACPDVVGDALATADLFELWAPAIARRGLPLALVAQDGLTVDSPWLHDTWHRLDALFVGGTTGFKLGVEAERLIREAKTRGLWVHMGRVNSRRRFDYARALGCDSIDGTKFSKWRDTWLPDALGWHKDHLQERASL